MQPINYQAQQPDIGNSFAEGIQMGNIIRQQRMLRQQEAEAEAYKAELNKVMSSNDPRGFIQLAAKYPKHGAGLKQAWEMQSEEQRKSEFGAARDIFYSIQEGRPDVALGVVDQQIEALKNSGKDARELERIRAGIERNPAQAAQYVGAFLSSVAPKEYAETLAKLGGERRAEEKAPSELARSKAEASKAGADAEKAAVAARFAEADIVKDLELKGWNIKKIQNDITVSQQNARIAAMNAAIGREANQFKREELQLKRDEALRKRDDEIRGKTADIENARFNIDNMLNTLTRITNTPNDVVRAATGPIDSMMPTLQPSVADFEALVENAGAQAFLSQIPQMKGTGALSDAEGKKLAAALQNFSLKQSSGQLLENTQEAMRLMTKARKVLADKYGVPETKADTPAAKAAPGTVLKFDAQGNPVK